MSIPRTIACIVLIMLGIVMTEWVIRRRERV